jgi:SAM-dependent methyltransferase
MGHIPISDTWERGNRYEQYIGRWSRKIAPVFLSLMRCPAELSWLDVGCGTGAVCAAILNQCSPASVIGLEPSSGFLNVAREYLGGRVALFGGSGVAIPFASSCVDIVVSGLVINFFIEPRIALEEMIRVTRNNGAIGAYVWDYAGKMEPLRLFWDAAKEQDLAAKQLDEGNRFPICHPDALSQLFSITGLKQIEVTSIDIQTEFANFEEYWQPFLGGQGPAPAYVISLDVHARARLKERLRMRIPIESDGKLSMVARAWAIRAIVNK